MPYFWFYVDSGTFSTITTLEAKRWNKILAQKVKSPDTNKHPCFRPANSDLSASLLSSLSLHHKQFIYTNFITRCVRTCCTFSSRTKIVLSSDVKSPTRLSPTIQSRVKVSDFAGPAARRRALLLVLRRLWYVFYDYNFGSHIFTKDTPKTYKLFFMAKLVTT